MCSYEHTYCMLSAACSRCPAKKKKKKQVWSNMHSHKSKPLYDLYIIHTVSSVSHSSPVEFKDVRLSSLHTLQLVFTVRLNSSSSSSGGATLLSLFLSQLCLFSLQTLTQADSCRRKQLNFQTVSVIVRRTQNIRFFFTKSPKCESKICRMLID